MLGKAMALDPFFAQKKILILDPDPKESNDRTWCFWEKKPGPFQALLSQSWSAIGVSDKGGIQTKSIAPYQYNMLEGAPFYQAMKAAIAQAAHIEFKQEAVLQINLQKEGLQQLTSSAGSYVAKRVLDSRFDYAPLLKQKKYPVLQQHFIGWFVKTKKPVFNKEEALFMDFSVAQNGNTRFMYLLPSSRTEALVEYTLFSKTLLETSEYETAIKEYLAQLGVKDYEITAKEQGSIPMSCYPFHKDHNAGYLKIGTAGGWSKASTGFTFQNTLKKTTALVQFLKTGKALDQFYRKNRFWLYDLVLLEVLATDNSQGKAIFEGLFRKRPAALVLKFLSEETHFLEELYIMSAAPILRFSKAFFKVLYREFFSSL